MDDNERDPPIEPQEYLAGVKVIDIGDVRVARGMTRRHHSGCRHRRLVYDNAERRVWCQDCERDVEGFDAFKLLVEGYDAALKRVERREATVSEAEKFALRSIAAKKMDEAWRSRSMVPACPHCSQGLFPEDFKNGPRAMLGKDYALAVLKRRQAQKENPA
jgi:hypothetical protein